jgi:hypothetical protein
MNELVDWLNANGVRNPHQVPPELKAEFKEKFDPETILWPQPGGQEQFQGCGADIVLYGGEAGAGKSWNILLDHLKWVHLPKYVGSVVRKTYAEIFDAGGLWAEAMKIFPLVGGRPSRGDKPKFVFPSGAQIYFKHSQHESWIERYWQGLQSAVISIDEATHFSKAETFYILSRNRSVCGVKSYMRMTCNPDPFSWIAEFIEWWLDEDGFIDMSKSGVIRYFIHRDDKFIWGDTKEELIAKYPKAKPLSFTFIRGYLEENKCLLDVDPGYLDRMDNLTPSQRRALLEGNWKELDNPNALFHRSNINANRVDRIRKEDLERIVVAIDPAGSTNENSDLTGIVTMGMDGEGHLYVLSDSTGKYSPLEWAEAACFEYDTWGADAIVAERNYGGDMVESTIRNHRPDIYPKMVNASRGKHVRAEPVAMMYAKGLVHHVGHDLGSMEAEMCNYVPRKKGQKSPNRMDAMVWAATELGLVQQSLPTIRQL